MTHATKPWVLLRVWHLETMESVVTSADPMHFTRTSYLSAPARWRDLPFAVLANRVEQVLLADYRRRAAQLRTDDDSDSLVPFSFYFEWVEDRDVAANPAAQLDPFMFPCAHDNPALAEIAVREVDVLVRSSRPGLANGCYVAAFSGYRIDEDDSWHIVGIRERQAMFESRHGARPE